MSLPAFADQTDSPCDKRIRKLKYHPRVQFNGVIAWLCPACGRVNRTRMGPSSGMELVCNARGCGALFTHGSVFWQRPVSKGPRPIDEPFPRAETAQLGRGRYIHAAVPCDEPGEPADPISSKSVLP